jgi:hypothetical protein
MPQSETTFGGALTSILSGFKLKGKKGWNLSVFRTIENCGCAHFSFEKKKLLFHPFFSFESNPRGMAGVVGPDGVSLPWDIQSTSRNFKFGSLPEDFLLLVIQTKAAFKFWVDRGTGGIWPHTKDRPGQNLENLKMLRKIREPKTIWSDSEQTRVFFFPLENCPIRSRTPTE